MPVLVRRSIRDSCCPLAIVADKRPCSTLTRVEGPGERRRGGARLLRNTLALRVLRGDSYPLLRSVYQDGFEDAITTSGRNRMLRIRTD